ncbi:hypothetical protein Bca4012_030713 [Brassica carinata]
MGPREQSVIQCTLILCKAEDATPEELRKQAVKETNKHKVHKKEGKSEEALKAFKRGKEFGRHADALEITLRKDRKRALSM